MTSDAPKLEDQFYIIKPSSAGGTWLNYLVLGKFKLIGESEDLFAVGIFSLGFQIGCQQSFVALGQAKVSLFLACLRKLILLIPLIYILPNFIDNKVFSVFLAEPISDILAATVTTIVFFARFQKILKKDPVAKNG